MNFTFVLTEEEASIVLESLIDQPYKKVAGVIDKMQRQAFDQREAAKSDPKTEQDKGK